MFLWQKMAEGEYLISRPFSYGSDNTIIICLESVVLCLFLRLNFHLFSENNRIFYENNRHIIFSRIIMGEKKRNLSGP